MDRDPRDVEAVVPETDDGGPPRPPAEALLGELASVLARLRDGLETDPFANPIRLLSLDLLARLRRGEVDDATLDAVVQRLTLEAFVTRAGRLRTYLGELAPERNAEIVAGLLRAAARGEDGERVPFEVFDGHLARIVYGFVFTAHPTFGMSAELMELLVDLAFGAQDDEERRRTARAGALRAPHRPPERLDLAAEHAMSLRVIANARTAVRRVARIALEVARELYPEEWRRSRPRLVSLASWVGYDTDGRSDIAWTATFANRLAVQVDQLAHYRDEVRALRGREGGGASLGALLELLEARLDLAIKSAEDELEVLNAPGAHDAAWAERLARMSRGIAAGRASRLTDAGQVLDLVERALAAAEDDETAIGLCVLRAELLTQGLAAARTHVRINAVQLHNAIRKSIGMDHAPDDPAHRLTYLQDVGRLVDAVEPVTVHFGSVQLERATAPRVFMTMAQMLKHLDGSEPLRFLIAECETPLTLLTALYFAKLFGLERRIDIAPLFETRKALERGAGIIADAVAVPAWRDYLQGRGRLCIQTGFSDAGRYMGQTAASAAIERVRLGVLDVMEREGLADLELVVFDTHGESIGRGAHPGGYADRLGYYDTPESRRRMARAGVAFREETSYQGGDGFLPFFDPDSAFAVLTRVLEHCLGPIEGGDDPFYAREAYIDEFFAAVAKFNKGVVEDPGYAAFLGAYGTNLVFPTGSRSLKRQESGARQTALLEHPSQLRAIPHNSILQQLGILANTIGGVGRAVVKDPASFRETYRESERFRRLVAMVEHAFKYTDLDVVQAYLGLFDPELWLRLAPTDPDRTGQEELRLVADTLERIDLHDRLARIFRIFHRDHMDLARAFREHRRATRDAGATPIAIDPGSRDNLHLLHAIRLALIQRLMLRAMRVPDFSDRHSITREIVVTQLVRLDVGPALDLLGDIFPILEETAAELDWGEPASYAGSDSQSYLAEHVGIFRPIARDYDLIRRIGSGIMHHLGAVG